MYLLRWWKNTPSFDSGGFRPVSQLVRFEFVVAVSPRRVTDFSNWWNGSGQSLQSQLWRCRRAAPFRISRELQLAKALGSPMTHVAYRGSTPIINDLLAATCRLDDDLSDTSRSIAPAAFARGV